MESETPGSQPSVRASSLEPEAPSLQAAYDPRSEIPICILILGDSTTSVHETAAAIIERVPHSYLNLEKRSTTGDDGQQTLKPVFRGSGPHFTRLKNGTPVMLYHDDHSPAPEVIRNCHAFAIVVGEDEEFEQSGFVQIYVRKLVEACKHRLPPILLLRTDRPFVSPFQQRCERHAAELHQEWATRRRLAGAVEFADVSSNSPNDELMAAFERLALGMEAQGCPQTREPPHGWNGERESRAPRARHAVPWPWLHDEAACSGVCTLAVAS